MFRIQLIIGVLSAGSFLHNLLSFFSPAFFLSKLVPHQLAAAIMPLVLNRALNTYF